MATTSKAFAPFGDSFLIPAAASAPTGVQVTIASRISNTNYSEYRIVNPGENAVYLGYGSTAAKAQANSVAPTSGTPVENVLVVLPLSIEILRFTPNAFFSGKAGGANDIFITIGEGV